MYHNEVLSLLPFSVLACDKSGHITFANVAAEERLGKSHHYLKGKKLSELVVPYQQLEILLSKTLKQGINIKEYDFKLAGPRICEQIVTLYISALPDGAILCFDDTRGGKTLEQTVYQKKNQTWQSAMAEIMAHEIKNPLASIRGAAQLLSKSTVADDREMALLICREADRIKNQIEEMALFAQPGELQMEEVNIHEIIRYACAATLQSTGVSITLAEKFDPSLPMIKGNKNLLIQALNNLLRNSMEAKKDGLTLTISTHFQSGAILKSNSGKGNKPLQVLVSIADNGPGIAEELAESIFDPFVTSKQSGKGLGLAIVSKIINDHNGLIELDKQVECGAKFNIMLPII